MGCAPRMDRASSLLGTEAWRLTLDPRPEVTSPGSIASSVIIAQRNTELNENGVPSSSPGRRWESRHAFKERPRRTRNEDHEAPATGQPDGRRRLFESRQGSHRGTGTEA